MQELLQRREVWAARKPRRKPWKPDKPDKPILSEEDRTMLADIIAAHAAAEADAADWAGVVVILNAESITKTDTTLRTSTWLINTLTDEVSPGVTQADVVLATLQAATHPRVIAANQLLSGPGIDLANPQSQALIPAIAAAASWPAGLADAILTAGIWQVSPSTEGGLGIVTEAEAEAAWDGRKLSQDWSTAQNDDGINDALANGDRAALVVALNAALVRIDV